MVLAVSEIFEHLEFWLGHIPGKLGRFARRMYYRRQLRYLGAGASVGAGFTASAPQNIHIGDEFGCWLNCILTANGGQIEIGNHVSLNANVYLNADIGGRIIIGDDVLIGPGVMMRTADHTTLDTTRLIRAQGSVTGDIVIESDVWLGAGVIVMRNVRIGRGAVVGAGAVVTRDVEPYTVVGGIPARFIKKRGEPSR